MDNNFYTYLWLREDGTPYYAGKGHGDRAIRKGSPDDLSRIIIQEHPSEHEALRAETFLIAYYGRKDNGTGILRNLTDGGEGTVGCYPSDETRRKLSEARRGNTNKLGKKENSRTRQRKSVAMRGNRNSRNNAEICRRISGLGPHARWHVRRGVVSAECALCQ